MASYVYGNTARQYSAVPKQQPERQPKRQPKQHKKESQTNVLCMNIGYVMFLAVATIVAMFVCVQYLQLQAEVSARSANVTALQRTLEEKKEANNTKYNSVMDSVNLEEIREKAMNELGMVYAKEGQIIRYKDPTKNSMTQYSSIPESGIITEHEIE